MAKKREEEPKTGEREMRKEKIGEKLNDDEETELLIQIYTQDDRAQSSNKARERWIGEEREYISKHPELRKLLRESSNLNPEQLRFVIKGLDELSRREIIFNSFRDTLRTHDAFLRAKEVLRGDLPSQLQKSKEASANFTIPGSDAHRQGELDFNLEAFEEWAYSYRNLDSSIRRARNTEERLIEPTEEELERRAKKYFESEDQELKKLIEKFEREKASVSAASKEEIPEEESEEDLGKARNEAESAFEEGGEKE